MIGLFVLLLALASIAAAGSYWINWDIKRTEPFGVHCWRDAVALGAKLWPWAKKKSDCVQAVHDI